MSDLSCESGYYMDVTQMQCAKCPVGHVSIGKGFKWDQWNEWPAQFNTYLNVHYETH